MDLLIFEKFKNECCQNLPMAVDKILSTGKHEKRCAIGLITTDDFYGFLIISKNTRLNPAFPKKSFLKSICCSIFIVCSLIIVMAIFLHSFATGIKLSELKILYQIPF